ncbi:phage tail protein [Brucella ciceri]|uniref:phage tail protein n=1 Tax=Brucella ciceri TaxID=391287 RepID=UPI001F132E30|nr:phage tail protein [Brucella ciceri]MCH6205207.1 phage tail protein [Brucella ciceri]
MPFLAPIFTAIGGLVSSVAAWAAASPILAGIAQTAFGIALKYAVNALFPPKTQSRASELETQYGANIPRSVILGTCATEGHHIYRNSYGSGGRLIQDVFVLSSFRITAVPRVRYNGEWRILSQQDAYGYWLVPNEGTSGDDHDNVRVKFFYGTMDQQAEPTLISNARPAGRWTANHRGAGVAYAVVFSELRKNGDGLTSPAKLLFEVVGAPLYDWRKDSTMGGSGPHRWDDQSTWEYSDNPVVQIYNLERGFFNGTQRMVGKAVRASRLPLAEYTQAANICDEIMSDGSKRYRAHAIAKDGPGANHDANLTPILEAMCGSWVERVDGEFPIAGAPQAIVATITDDDIKRGAPLRFSAKRKRTELINTVAASYVSPEDFYETKDAATRIDEGALAEDRETLASAIPYAAVTDVRQVDRLADIAIRGARYQASAEIVVHPRFLDTIKEGRWVRWNSAKYGDRTFQVLTRQLGGINTDGARDISIALQQISNGVFDPTAYETNPPNIIVVPPPQYLAEVQGFDVIPTIVKADGAGELPGARLLWDTIDDISVVGVDIEYWPANDPSQVFKRFVTWDVVNVLLVEGLTSLTDWFVRTRLRVDNGRSVAWSAAKPFRTLNAQGDQNPIDYEGLADDLKGYLGWIGPQVRELIRQAEELATLTADNHNSNYSDIQRLTRQLSSTFGNAQAMWQEDIIVATGPNSAIGQQLTRINAQLWDNTGASIIQLLQVRVDGVEDDVAAQANLITQLSSNIGEVSANATFRMGTYAAPSGWNSRIGMEVRGGTTDSYKSAGLFLDVTSTQARIALIAEQIVFSNGTEFFKPFVIQNNVMYGEGFVMDWAKIVNVQIGTAQIGDAAITSAKIGNLQVKTSNLDFGSVTQVFNASGSSPNPGNQNTPACSLLTINPQGNTCLITFGWSITWTSSSSSSVTISLINVTTGVTVASAQSPSSNGATFSDYITMIDTSAVSGNNNYELRYAGTGIPIVSAFSGTIRALVWKR